MMFSGCDDPTPFKVVHCGLKTEKYVYRPPKQSIKRVFCAARLSAEKGLTVLIEALRLLADRGHYLELTLAGDGPSRQQLSLLATRLGLSDQVKFLGYISEQEVINELQDSDLFVLPSFVEGVPVAAMEAMAVGVPVIATNIAGTSELIEDGKTGVLIRPSDSRALADAIVWMIEHYDFRVRAAELARKRILEEFDVDNETVRLNRYLLESCNDIQGECREEALAGRRALTR